ncbi:MAG: hypothetical protein A2W08_01405 [Candidatus Rokubacteria bacterium RBG_16_73_20]|nr:MAG: hypothetical protein A2W08_01405 [Candidatus Rokubacteria bacterium RBG_16_73_20]
MDGAAVHAVGEVLDPLDPLARLDGVHQLLERELALAPHHEVRVLEPLIRQEARVRAADDHDPARRADAVGEPIGLGRRRGDRGDRHEVRGENLLRVDVPDVLDVDADVVALGTHDRAEEDRAEPGDADAAVDVQVRRLRLDEDELLERSPHR